jgi:phosphoribosylformimino-5-aminoimidazole carboxamide ribotide isomerase
VIIIPAIDLRNGKCVRLRHGNTTEETVYSDDPVAMAERWIAAGAKRLHVVDLDGAFSGEPKNLEWVMRIKRKTKATIQMGGGLRTLEAIHGVLKAGIDKVILGSIIVEEAGLAKQAFDAFRGQIMVALDVKNDQVAIHGWKDNSGFPLAETLSIVEKLGGQDVIFTDIGRDGTLEGVNLNAVKDVMKKTKMNVYASGGVSSLEDITKLKSINSPGCIVGKAIYEGKVDLAEAIRIAN